MKWAADRHRQAKMSVSCKFCNLKRRKNMKKYTLILLALTLTFGGSLLAQDLKFPQPSPAASVKQAIGITEVEITYHRPGVRGRVIWGGLVPYDEIWRTGANQATTIEFSGDVMIEGNKVAAGKYGLFTIPGKTEWTVIFSKQADLWGTGGYKEEEDALRIKVKPMDAPFPCDWMHFMFGDLKDDSAKVFLHWEKLMIAFTVTVDTKDMVLKSLERTMDRYWVSPYRAAGYALDQEMPDKAKEWIDTSTALKKSYWNMFLKAKVYKKTAKTENEIKDAVKILEEAIQLGKDLPEQQQQYVEEAKKLLAEWTAKK
jgi:hypothetical protein